MNSEQNIINTEPHQELQDNSGLTEIQQALEEIEKLKNNPEESEEEPKEVVEVEVQDNNPEEDSEKQEKKENKLWKEKKRKYQAIAEKEALMEENLQLKQMLNDSLNSGTYHYGKSAYADLERAKGYKKKAIEEGNIDALLDADIAITKAVNTINDLEKWTYTEDQRKSQAPQYTQEQTYSNYNEIQQEMAQDWLENHEYLQPSSSTYNPKKANQVADFINHLDTNLAKKGQMDAYFSEPYFEKIDQYIASIANESKKNSKSLENTSHVGGVRNSYSSSITGKTSSPTQMILTADEKRMCANAGISEKEWLKYKLEDLKKGK